MSRKPDVTRPSRKPDAIDIIAAIWMLVALSTAAVIWACQAIWMDERHTESTLFACITLVLIAGIGATLIRALCSNTEKEPRKD